MSRDEIAAGAHGRGATVTPGGAAGPLFGRDRELAALAGAILAVDEGRQTRVVTVIGPGGLGKSRLIAEFLGAARARGSAAAARVTEASARDEGTAYGLFGRLLRARFGVEPEADADAARAAIRSSVVAVMGDRKVGDVLYFLGQLIGLPFDESPLTRAVQDDYAEAALIRRAVLKAFLEADAAHAPICIVLDDLHAAHDDSLDLLRYLIGALDGPLLLVCAARPELSARHEEWGRGDERRRVLELGPLSERDSAALMEALLAPAGEPPAALVSAACAFAAGSPQLLEQMVRVYHERGVLVDEHEPPGWRVDLAKLSSAELPMTVEDMVSVRLAALEGAERAVLERAAAVGPVCWSGALLALGRAAGAAPELWEDADGGDVAALGAALASLVQRGHLARRPGSMFAGSDEYAFQHSREREALLRRTSRAAQRRYHRAMADWLELQGCAGEESVALLASHLEQAGDEAGAGMAWLDAADAARARFGNITAAEQYRRGLALLGEAHVGRRIDALHHHGDVLQLAGRVEEALAAFREMLTLAYRLDNRRKGGAAHNRIGRLHRDAGALDEACRHFTTALRLFEAAGDERGVASTIDDIGKLHWHKGEYQEALGWLRDALGRREQMGDRRSIALSLNNLGLALQDSGEFKQARLAFERSLAIRREISDLSGIVASLNNLGTTAQDQGDHRRAMQLFEEALLVARQVGDRNRIALVLINIGETHYRGGDPDEGVRVLRQAEELCDELGDKLLLAEVLRGLAKAHLLRGDLQKAREAISRAVDVLTSVRSRVQLGVALRTLAEITAGGGWGSAHTKSARAYFDRSVAILGETGNEVELGRTLKAYARYLTTEPAYQNNRSARRDAALMAQRADAIFTRLQISSTLDEEATDAEVAPASASPPSSRISSLPPGSEGSMTLRLRGTGREPPGGGPG